MEVQMAQQIYKAYFVKFKDAWYQLTKSQQDDLLKKVGAALEKAGGKPQLICNTNWSSDAWQAFGYEVFPNIEAVQEHSKLLNELNWFHFVDGFSALGTEM